TSEALYSLGASPPLDTLYLSSNNIKVTAHAALFTPRLAPFQVLSSTLHFPSDASGCVTEKRVTHPAIFVVRRGECGFAAKVANAEFGGAEGVVVVNSDSMLFPMAGGEGGGVDGTRVPAWLVETGFKGVQGEAV
ncbi:hypothetical protein HK096_000885, partial [Nowakowskiella sp. JEL0078]